MREKGIKGIGEGRLDKDSFEVRCMFGPKIFPGSKKYPQTIKLLFLTGNKFLKDFQQNIIDCLDNGCKIELLLASYKKNNSDYLKRCATMFGDEQSGKVADYAKEIVGDTLKTIEHIKDNTHNPDNFKIRFYMDEYHNNIRIAEYENISFYWVSVQPISKVAIDLSISLKGWISTDELENEKKAKIPTEENNICLASEKGFDKLWKIYEATEYNGVMWNDI